METSVVVVHGIGDPLPGNALEKLVQGVRGSRGQNFSGSSCDLGKDGKLSDAQAPSARGVLGRHFASESEPIRPHQRGVRSNFWSSLHRGCSDQTNHWCGEYCRKNRRSCTMVDSWPHVCTQYSCHGDRRTLRLVQYIQLVIICFCSNCGRTVRFVINDCCWLFCLQVRATA